MKEQKTTDQITQSCPEIVAASNMDQLMAKNIGDLRSWPNLLADFRQQNPWGPPTGSGWRRQSRQHQQPGSGNSRSR